MDTAKTNSDAQPVAASRKERTAVLTGIVGLFFLLQIVSALTPPFQSLDEFNHLKRAYLLSKGQVLLGSVDNITGGYIDAGLLDYMGTYTALVGQYGNTVPANERRLAEEVTWREQTRFSSLINTALYFPIPYIPQAMGLQIGKSLGLRIETTYYLTRFICIFVSLTLIYLAWLMYPIPLFSAAVLVFPMSLYQMSSTSLDSTTFALCALTASLFMRGADARMTFNPGMHWALALCLLALAASRIVLIPLTLLPISLYIVRRRRVFLMSAFALIVGSISWILAALRTVHGEFLEQGSAAKVAGHYLISPLSLFRVFKATLTDRETLRHYWTGFVGVLGWVGAPLDFFVYVSCGVTLLLLAVVCFERNIDRLFSVGNLTLTLASFTCLLLIFFVELCVITPQPAVEIVGVQGRYFIPIAIFLGFSIFNRSRRVVESIVALSTILIMVWLSMVSMVPKLAAQYWGSG